MTFDPHFQRTQIEREDSSGITIHNESNKLPGHEERMDAHCARIKGDYFDTGLHYLDMHAPHSPNKDEV